MRVLSKDIKKEILRFAVGVIILGALGEAVIAAFFSGNNEFLKLVLGMLIGCVYVIFNFAYTAFSVCKSADKGDKAKMYMQLAYMSRMVFLVIFVLCAIYIPVFNVYSAVIPLLFTRIVILAEAVLFKNKDGKNNER